MGAASEEAVGAASEDASEDELGVASEDELEAASEVALAGATALALDAAGALVLAAGSAAVLTATLADEDSDAGARTPGPSATLALPSVWFQADAFPGRSARPILATTEPVLLSSPEKSARL